MRQGKGPTSLQLFLLLRSLKLIGHPAVVTAAAVHVRLLAETCAAKRRGLSTECTKIYSNHETRGKALPVLHYALDCTRM